jgi:hypothetical protein
MKSDGMKKFLHELVLYFWIPIIVAVVSYIFFELNDYTLGITLLVGSTVVYSMIRLYFTYKKWWFWLIVGVVVLGIIGIVFLKVPATNLTINGIELSGTNLTLPEGTVTVNPAPQGNGQYTKNTVVTLTAEPIANYDWAGWNGTDTDNQNPTTVTMTEDKAVEVKFEKRYSLIINNQQVIGSIVSFTEGTVVVSPPPSNADGKYSHDTKVTLTVHPNTGYDWLSWSGTEDDNANPTTVTMASGEQIMLSFSGRFELTINGQTVNGSTVLFSEGTVYVQPAPGSDDKYASGTEVTLQANPYSGFGWESWSGTDNQLANPTTLTINGDKHINVNWAERYTVTINNQPLLKEDLVLTGGKVTVNPAPQAGGGFAKSTKVTFTATPAAGYRFGYWSGDISGMTNPVMLTMNSDITLNVVFIKTYTLTVIKNPSAGGTVSPNSGTYDEGTNITLTATPSSGYRFNRWDGASTSLSATLTLIMDGDKTIAALFMKTFKLTVKLSPPAGGTVFPGTNVYDTGSTVTLTATPAPGYRFDQWQGSATGSDTSVTVTMDTDKIVTAVFIKTYVLSVTVNPPTGGLVAPSGGVFDAGANVTLTAMPATGYTFDHWEGAASGNESSVTITMDADKTVTAVFIAGSTTISTSPAANEPASLPNTTDKDIVAVVTTSTNASRKLAARNPRTA